MARMGCRRQIIRRSTARRFIEFVHTTGCRKIISMLGIGMIFFAERTLEAAPSPVSLTLAVDCLAEGDWATARREALRVLAANPANDVALLLAADATLAGDPQSESARRVLIHLSTSAADASLRVRAAYRAGQACWSVGDRRGAWAAFARAFQQAEERAMFLRSGCALFLLRREEPTLGADDPALVQQLATCRDLWNFDLRDEVRLRPPRARQDATPKPAAWVVSFYRSHIRPAIGHRCSLEPNCSAYFLEASRAHGWLGLPLIADRLVREPGVVQAAEEPVERDGAIRFRDPLVNHTEWWSGEN